MFFNNQIKILHCFPFTSRKQTIPQCTRIFFYHLYFWSMWWSQFVKLIHSMRHKFFIVSTIFGYQFSYTSSVKCRSMFVMCRQTKISRFGKQVYSEKLYYFIWWRKNFGRISTNCKKLDGQHCRPCLFYILLLSTFHRLNRFSFVVLSPQPKQPITAHSVIYKRDEEFAGNATYILNGTENVSRIVISNGFVYQFSSNSTAKTECSKKAAGKISDVIRLFEQQVLSSHLVSKRLQNTVYRKYTRSNLLDCTTCLLCLCLLFGQC